MSWKEQLAWFLLFVFGLFLMYDYVSRQDEMPEPDQYDHAPAFKFTTTELANPLHPEGEQKPQ